MKVDSNKDVYQKNLINIVTKPTNRDEILKNTESKMRQEKGEKGTKKWIE